jgi:hypothetical protein
MARGEEKHRYAKRYQFLPPVSPEESAAILDMDGGLLRNEAEQQAVARLAHR